MCYSIPLFGKNLRTFSLEVIRRSDKKGSAISGVPLAEMNRIVFQRKAH